MTYIFKTRFLILNRDYQGLQFSFPYENSYIIK